MRDVNKIILLGRLGNDPIQRETKTGLAVVHFSVATSRKSLDPETEETQWHNIVAWGKQGEACAQYLKKGKAVFVEGSLRSHKYNAKDGTSKVAYEVHADSVSFVSGQPVVEEVGAAEPVA